MNVIDMLRAVQSQGMGLLSALRGMSKKDVAAIGVSQSTAGRWLKLADTFFGPTRARKKQAAAVAAATEGGLSIDALVVVEKHLAKLLGGDEWAVRVELCRLTGTVDEIDKEAAARVRELNRGVDPGEGHAKAKRSVKGGKNTDGHGCRTMTVTGPEREIVALKSALEKTTKKLRRANPNLSYEQAMYDALLAGGRAEETLTPLVVIALPDFAKLLRNEGDECIFGLTDGTTITGAKLVEQLVTDAHFVGLYDPVEGPVNLYRSKRIANDKQRMLLSAESLLCEWDDCTTPADQSAEHHIDAWRHGGHTAVCRMTKLCPPHNGMNDDDPNAPPRNGRMERINGEVVRVHGDDPPTRNTHPLKKLSAAAIARGLSSTP